MDRFVKYSLHQEQGLEKTQPAVRALRTLLGRRLKIELPDERVVIGIFVCVDKQKNFVLGNTVEYLPGDDVSGPNRAIGVVIVPGRHVVRCEVEAAEGETELALEAPECEIIPENEVPFVSPYQDEWYKE